MVRTAAPTDYLTPSDLGTNMIAKIPLTTGTVLSREMIKNPHFHISNGLIILIRSNIHFFIQKKLNKRDSIVLAMFERNYN